MTVKSGVPINITFLSTSFSLKKKEQLKIAKKTMSIDGQTYLPAEVFEQLLKRDTFTMKIGKKKKEVLHGRLYTFLKDNQYIFNYI